MSDQSGSPSAETADFNGAGFLAALRRHVLSLIGLPIASGVTALAVTYLVAPTYTASTSLLPPQLAQSAAISALSSLGSLAAIGGTGVRTPADQMLAILQSRTVSERIIDEFKLMPVYESKFRIDAVHSLAEHVRATIGKRDGLIRIEVDDTDARRAADMANRYVVELRRMVDVIAITEAQQRRMFFEAQLQKARLRLAGAQRELQSSGYTQGSLKAEPKAAAESYARIQAEITASEVRLQALRANLVDTAPEIKTQMASLSALREQLARQEKNVAADVGQPDFIDKYREFKYQEFLFELYAKQFESARMDESREATLIQVLDPATAPERRSSPRRTLTAVVTAALVFALLLCWILFSGARDSREAKRDHLGF